MPAMMRNDVQMPARPAVPSMRQRLPQGRAMRAGPARAVAPFMSRPTATTRPMVPQAHEVQAGMDPRVVATLYGVRGIYGLGGLGGPFDFITDIAKTLIPEKTVAGKALRGDYKGASADAAKFVAQTGSALINRQRPPGVPAAVGGAPEFVDVGAQTRGVNVPLILGGAAVGLGLVWLLVRSRSA